MKSKEIYFPGILLPTRVHAKQYALNLEKDLDGYFVSPAGKEKARELLRERFLEVQEWEKL